MVCLEDREVEQEIFRQYKEIKKTEYQIDERPLIKNVIRSIVESTGVLENNKEPIFTGLHRNAGRRWSKEKHAYLTAKEIANGKRGG